MQDLKNTAEKVLLLLEKHGASKAQCSVKYSETREFNVDGGEFSLFRTLFDNALSMTAFKDGKKGSVNVNRFDDTAIETAVCDCIASSDSSIPDTCWDISDVPADMHFEEGAVNPDMDKFFDRLREFMADITARHPLILVEQLIASHTKTHILYANSNGVQYDSIQGAYSVDIMFSAHDGKNSSSFFGSGAVFADLDKPFITLASFDKDMFDIEKQINPKPLEGKFEGVVIMPPSCLGSMAASAVSNFAGDNTVLDGTSIWKNSIGAQVADKRITISMKPLDSRIVCGERYTDEGFLSEDFDIIKDGILKNFHISQYVANKTGFKRAPNSSWNMIIQPGTSSVEDMIANVKKGIVIGRFSGGQPGTNGEFSGVAKNSFLIEDGKIICALSETMINGNLSDLLCSVIDISKETVCDGTSVLPFISFGGVTISGK